jgi:phosphoglycerate kinase
MKKTVKDMELAGKRVLARMDFNVPLENDRVADDLRIRASLPTIQYLIDQDARIILCSHLGRPKNSVDKSLQLDPVAKRLAELLNKDVKKVNDCIGPDVEAAVESLDPGEVLLLENTRFHPEEKKNDPDFAQKLARGMEIFVNDAFAAAHRAHASTEGVAHHLPGVAGMLLEKELEILHQTTKNPEHPFAGILGGVKVSDKIGVIERFIDQMELLLIGGAMANNFLKVKGYDVGQSRIEEDQLDTASRLLDKGGEKLVLPKDVVVHLGDFAPGAERRTVSVDEIPAGGRIADIGPKTVEMFKEKLEPSKTVIWNGPMGRFEMEPFDRGTIEIARFLADINAVTVIGGGDTAAAINRLGLADAMTHVSTGGGAFLEFLEGRELPGVAALQDR